uniref:Uncharacterized protein n=1 Tax=Zea mays TaxID=4577 RepID=B6TYV5_MAIZE|nr:hypothetical protein [Zea mays]
MPDAWCSRVGERGREPCYSRPASRKSSCQLVQQFLLFSHVAGAWCSRVGGVASFIFLSNLRHTHPQAIAIIN